MRPQAAADPGAPAEGFRLCNPTAKSKINFRPKCIIKFSQTLENCERIAAREWLPLQSKPQAVKGFGSQLSLHWNPKSGAVVALRGPARHSGCVNGVKLRALLGVYDYYM